MFSTTIKVPVEVLQNNASKIIAFADESEDIFDRISNMLVSLENGGAWKGVSLKKALNYVTDHKKKYGEAMTDLRELGDFLKKFASDMEAKDLEIKSKIDAV